MAVQQRRNSKTRKAKRRTHYKLPLVTLVRDKKTGEFVRPHHVSLSGNYNGKKVIND